MANYYEALAQAEAVRRGYTTWEKIDAEMSTSKKRNALFPVAMFVGLVLGTLALATLVFGVSYLLVAYLM